MKLRPDPEDGQIIADWLELGQAGALAVQSGIDVRAMLAGKQENEVPSIYIEQFTLITRLTAEEWGLDTVELHGRSKVQPIPTARMVAMRFCRNLSDASLAAVGGFFERDHGTVSHAIQKVTDWISTDYKFAMKVSNVLKRLMEHDKQDGPP